MSCLSQSLHTSASAASCRSKSGLRPRRQLSQSRQGRNPNAKMVYQVGATHAGPRREQGEKGGVEGAWHIHRGRNVTARCFRQGARTAMIWACPRPCGCLSQSSHSAATAAGPQEEADPEATDASSLLHVLCVARNATRDRSPRAASNTTAAFTLSSNSSRFSPACRNRLQQIVSDRHEILDHFEAIHTP